MNIFNFEFKRLFKGNIIWALVCSVLIVMFMLFFPSMKDAISKNMLLLPDLQKLGKLSKKPSTEKLWRKLG